MFLPEDDFSTMKGRHTGTQEPARRKEIKTVRGRKVHFSLYVLPKPNTDVRPEIYFQ